MADSFPHAYIIGNLILASVWILLFTVRKDLRHKILLMSFLVAPIGPLSEIFYLRDYWRPELLGGFV